MDTETLKEMLRTWNGPGEDLMGAALAEILALEAELDEGWKVDLVTSSGEKFETLDLNREEYAQLIRIGVTELLRSLVQDTQDDIELSDRRRATHP